MHTEPPRPNSSGAFVPAALLQDPTLSPTALHTWALLRCLAGPQGETAPTTISELCRYTGKSRTVLYQHLALLKQRGALRWHGAGQGALVIAFETAGEEPGPPGQSSLPAVPRQAGAAAKPPDSGVPDSGQIESGIPDPGLAPSLNPLNINDSESKSGFRERGKLQKSGIPDWGTSALAAHPAAEAGQDEPAAGNPLSVYRRITGRRPNPSQRQKLAEQVRDLDLWQRTLEHWQMHGWNPLNLAGILELYQRGGPAACRYCGEARPAGQKPGAARPPMLDVLNQMRKDSPHGRKP